jgi:hypothetical protein
MSMVRKLSFKDPLLGLANVKWGKGINTIVRYTKYCIEGHFTHETEGPWPLRSTHSHWWGKKEPVQVRFTRRLRDQMSMWMQDGCKVYMDSYMALSGSCLMVTWIIFKNHLLEVGPSHNREIVAFGNLTTIDLFYLSCVRIRINENSLE